MQLTDVVETVKANNSANKTLVTLFITGECTSSEEPPERFELVQSMMADNTTPLSSANNAVTT